MNKFVCACTFACMWHVVLCSCACIPYIAISSFKGLLKRFSEILLSVTLTIIIATKCSFLWITRKFHIAQNCVQGCSGAKETAAQSWCHMVRRTHFLLFLLLATILSQALCSTLCCPLRSSYEESVGSIFRTAAEPGRAQRPVRPQN